MATTDVLGRPIGYVVPPEDRQPIVTDWSGHDDYVNAPPDYGTFYRQYRSYTYYLVRKFAPPKSDIDDVVADIIMRFIERDSIGVFSSEWATRSATGRSNFRSYYSRFVVTYARGKTRNVYKHNGRNVLIFDAPVSDDGSVSWGDENASGEISNSNDMEFELLVSRIKAEIDESLYDALFAILDMAGEMCLRDVKWRFVTRRFAAKRNGRGWLSEAHLAKRLGIRASEAQQILDKLKPVIARVAGVA